MNVYEIIMHNVKKLMKKNNLSIEDCATLLKLDIKILNEIFSYKRMISSDCLQILCNTYNVSFDYFFGMKKMLEEHYIKTELKELYLDEKISINIISEILKIDNKETRQMIKEWRQECI